MEKELIKAQSRFPDSLVNEVLLIVRTEIQRNQVAIKTHLCSGYRAKPGNEPPPHWHEVEDETLYVLEGEMEAYLGDQVLRIGPGENAVHPAWRTTRVVHSVALVSNVDHDKPGTDGWLFQADGAAGRDFGIETLASRSW